MQVKTQLAFKGQCREAFELYEKVLGGKILVMNILGTVSRDFSCFDLVGHLWGSAAMTHGETYQQ